MQIHLLEVNQIIYISKNFAKHNNLRILTKQLSFINFSAATLGIMTMSPTKKGHNEKLESCFAYIMNTFNLIE